jgi:hypothetical protein
MEENHLKIIKGLLVLSIIIFLLGIGITFYSRDFGDKEGNKYIKGHGGSADTSDLLTVIEDTSISYKLIGTTLSLVSGFGIITCCIGLHKNS